MKTKFIIDVGGDPDHEDLVAEIYSGENPTEDFVAMVSHDQGLTSAEIEIYPRKDGKPWSFDLVEFQEAIKKARQRLWDLRRSDTP